jgi:poly(3-hydroxybutyrate) depolymerase
MKRAIIILAMAAIAAAVAVLPAMASDLHVPAGMMLCSTLADAMSPTHAGCWIARGGQNIERINPMPTVSQLLIRTTDGSETMVVYGLRDEADQIQRVAR